MQEEKNSVSANKRFWKMQVSERCGFTEPWLDLSPDELRAHVEGRNQAEPDRLDNIFPWECLRDVAKKDVLCLASGGGQQSVVFSLLGAQVTVVDFVEEQLEADRTAATHYGYDVRTVCSDMQDLHELDSESFDLIFQAPSMCYAEEIRKVYTEAYRVLRTGGMYRADAGNPAMMFVDESWTNNGYRIMQPYSQTTYTRPDGAIEFRHYLSDAFNELINSGFSIRSVHEAPNHRKNYGKPSPGSWKHLLMHLPWTFAIIARK